VTWAAQLTDSMGLRRPYNAGRRPQAVFTHQRYLTAHLFKTMKSREKIVDAIILGRARLFELLMAALLLAFGVNLVSGSLPQSLNLSPLGTFLIGLVFCIAPAGYLLFRFLGRREQVREYEAFFLYSKKQNSLVDVPRYDFAEKLTMYLKAAFVENEALKVLWDKEPLGGTGKDLSGSEGEGQRPSIPRSKHMMSELIGYYVFEKLSTHLADYFEQGEFAQQNLCEFGRKDIPEVLLSNRFLELFSRPMEDRSHFVQDSFEEHSNQVIYAGDEHGALYNKFELVLPGRSSVLRPERDSVEIHTGRMRILIQVRFDGLRENLPTGFQEAYLGFHQLEDYLFDLHPFEVKVVVKVVFKFGALLSRKGWEYYRWIDSFLDTLNEDLSKKEYFSRLGWESAYTVHMLQNRQSQQAQPIEKRPPHEEAHGAEHPDGAGRPARGPEETR